MRIFWLTFLRYITFIARHLVGKIYDFYLYIQYIQYMYTNNGKVKYNVLSSGESIANHRICVFVLYQPKGISKNTIKYLDAICRQGFSIIAVSNCSINSGDLDLLNSLCFQIILRDNVGRDFGAYKTGVLEIYKQNLPVDNLLIANDSVHAPLHDLSIMHAEMERKDCDFWGVADNNDIGYHVGSYYVMFNSSVVNHAGFKSFWENYLEKNSRRHAVRNGEVALSQALIKLGFRVGVYRTSKDIVNLIFRLGVHDLIHLLYKINIPVLHKYAPSAFDAISDLEKLRSEINLLARYLSQESSIHSKVLRHRLALSLGEIFDKCSAAHIAALLYNNYLDFPLLKKDLVFREIYDLGFLMANIKISSNVELSEVESDFRFKGLPRTAHFLKRMLIYSGYM